MQGAAHTGQLLSSHPSVAKMSFTGGVHSGSKVMQACAQVRRGLLRQFHLNIFWLVFRLIII